MKITLLGGSNSILKSGFITGLKEENEVLELALGATTSLQNLNSVIRHNKQILTTKIIITESNVNDIHATHRNIVPINIIIKNIDNYYYELSKLNINVIVLLLPLNTKIFKNYSIINNCHIYNCNIYGFGVIDLSSKFELQENFLKDILHINLKLIQDLGYRISSSINYINTIINSENHHYCKSKNQTLKSATQYINIPFNKALKNSTLKVFSDAAHAPQEEIPTLVTDEIIKFIKESQ